MRILLGDLSINVQLVHSSLRCLTPPLFGMEPTRQIMTNYKDKIKIKVHESRLAYLGSLNLLINFTLGLVTEVQYFNLGQKTFKYT